MDDPIPSGRAPEDMSQDVPEGGAVSGMGSSLFEPFLDEGTKVAAVPAVLAMVAAASASASDDKPKAPAGPSLVARITGRFRKRAPVVPAPVVPISSDPAASSAPFDPSASSGRLDPAASPGLPDPPATPNAPATKRKWRTVGRALCMAMALLLALTGFLAASRVSGTTATPAATRPGPAATGPASGGSATVAPPASQTVEPTQYSRPKATAPMAVVTFRDLVAQPAGPKSQTPLTFMFTTDGPGPVYVSVSESAPLSSTKICYAVDAAEPVCAAGATPGFETLDATTAHSQWSVTLTSGSIDDAIVTVQLRWPTDTASVSIAHARFQGAPNPDSQRSLVAEFTTRKAGSVSFAASWSPASTRAALTVSNVGRRGFTPIDIATFSGASMISPAYSHRLAARSDYQLQLTNAGPDAGKPDLVATLTFP